MNNAEIENELFGFDFELIRIDHVGESKTETSIKTSDDIEDIFDKALMLSTKSLNQLKKKNKDAKVESIVTDFGYEIYQNKVKVQEFFIKELKKEEVS